ncbi:MAG: FAD-dependent thymidylate synthase [Verrucomicrobiaceae bacterium]|nr:MAG: FAD-dependent thymidylate synthase [Verrucomicrobiaceae bacterium]
MTKQTEILHDPKYIAVLDHGFVGLVDSMGSDSDIVSAARVSYGDGTKSVSQDRGLIRYLVSHRHTSPIEMAEVKLHIKMPIFIMRQWVRHRTASLNEYSGRYSIMSDEFYRPTGEALAAQSVINNQGRGDQFDPETQASVEGALDAAFNASYTAYTNLVTPTEGYPGLARELARTVMPLANYTELYWKQDLHNLLHLIKLRRDSHAQKEIQAYAEAVYTLIKPLFPLTIEAWEDYVWYGHHMSRMEGELMQLILGTDMALEMHISITGGEKEFAEARGMSLRELRAFRARWNV